MANELGKVIADGLARMGRGVEKQAPIRQTGEAIRKAAEGGFGQDRLVRSAARDRLEQTASGYGRPLGERTADAAVKQVETAADRKAVEKLAAGAAKDATTADLDAQVAKATVKATADGTLVKQLPTQGAKDVTFLTYKAYDNELSTYIPQHLNELEKVGTTDRVNVLAFTDGNGANDTRKYLLRKDASLTKVTSPYVPASAAGELDTNDPKTIEAAIKWGFGDYPSKITWFDANDHGAGWYGIFQDQSAKDSSRVVRPGELATAVLNATGGKGVDLMSFDACMEDTLETHYAMRRAAKVIVASEDETFPLGMNYGSVMADLQKNPTTDPVAIGKLILQHAQTTGADVVANPDAKGVRQAVYQIAVVDTSKIDPLASSVDQLAKALNKAMPTQRAAITDALHATQPFYVASHGGYDWGHRDLVQMATLLKQKVDDADVKAAADKVVAATTGPDGAVLQTVAADEEQGATRGMAIYLPLDGNVDAVYKETDFAKDTPSWVQFLESLKQAPAAPAK